jgi:hypothetical protein
MGDEDLKSIIAYLRTLPPVDREVPDRRIGPVTMLVILSGKAPEVLPADLLENEPYDPHVAPRSEDTAEYGRYLIDISGCKVCHKDDLSGGLHPLSLPEEPPPPDLRPGGPLSDWSEQDFTRAMRTGINPAGRVLDNKWMPWQNFSRMSDLELRAIWKGLK